MPARPAPSQHPAGAAAMIREVLRMSDPRQFGFSEVLFPGLAVSED